MSYIREQSSVFVDDMHSQVKHACVIRAFEHEKVLLNEWCFSIACSIII